VLKRGRDYRPGDVALFVRVGRGRQADTDLRYYYATRRRDGSASLKVSRGAGAHPVPVLRLRTKRPLRVWKVRLNGRRVGREFSLDDGSRGLRGRLGRHVLRVLATGPSRSAERSPATFRWRVALPRRHRR
jgi:hypothetical protein